MEITSFHPMIATPRFEETKALFEALGFKVAHTTPDFITNDPKMIGIKLNCIQMKNADGYRVGICTRSDLTQDSISIRMNVRDFDAACAVFHENGFTDISEVGEIKYMKWVSMKSPSGFEITVIYHIREHD